MSADKLPAPEILYLVNGAITCESIKKEYTAHGIWVHVPSISQNMKFHWHATADSTSGGTDVKVMLSVTPGHDGRTFLKPYNELLAPVRRGELTLNYSYTDASGTEFHSKPTTVGIELLSAGGQLCNLS